MVELAEHLVEEVAQGGGVAVAVVAAVSVVPAGGTGVDGSVGGPYPSDGGEPVVLDAAVRDRGDFTRGAGDRRGPGVCLQRPVVGESGTVVTDLGKNARTGQVRQAGETGDYGVVGVLAEFFTGQLFEFVGASAGGVEHRQQRQGLAAHRLLDESGLAQLWNAQALNDVGGEIVDAALASSPAQCGGDAGLGELGRVRRSGGDGQYRTGMRFGQVGGGLSGEGVQERWVVLTQRRAQLVDGFAAAPDRVLL